MPYIDVKITTWERYHFDTSSNMNEIIDTIKEEGINFYPAELSDSNSFTHYEKLDETDEYITVEDNNGLATIEVYDDEGKLLYHNGDEENYLS